MENALFIIACAYVVIGAVMYFSVLGQDLKTGKHSVTGFIGTLAGTSGLFELLFLFFWPLWAWLYWRTEKKAPIQPPETTRGK